MFRHVVKTRGTQTFEQYVGAPEDHAVSSAYRGVSECGGDGGLADIDSDGERLQQLRRLLPCDVSVVAETHPLCGERLAAIGFRRKRNELLLVVVLPDGTPGMIAAAATDVFGERSAPEWAPTPLSVEGVRRLRILIEAASRWSGEATTTASVESRAAQARRRSVPSSDLCVLLAHDRVGSSPGAGTGEGGDDPGVWL
jgi:hypothetical protein